MKWNPKKARRNARYEESDQLRRKQVEHRIQTVIWELGEGKPGAQVERVKIDARLRELEVLKMSNTAFQDYRDRVLEKFPLPSTEAT